MTRFDGGAGDDAGSGPRRGKVDLSLGQRVHRRGAGGGIAGGSAPLIDAVGRGYQALANDRALETSPALQARLAILQAIYIERPTGKNGNPKTIDPIFDGLRRKFFGGRFGQVGAGYVNVLLGVVDLERGRTAGGRSTWRRSTAWPRAATRRCCGDSRIDSPPRRSGQPPSDGSSELRIADSPFPEVRAQAAAVEAGSCRRDQPCLAGRPAGRARLARRRKGARAQRARAGRTSSAIRRRSSGTRRRRAVGHPQLSLRGALWVEVTGLSRPITICGPSRATIRRRVSAETTSRWKIPSPSPSTTGRFASGTGQRGRGRGPDARREFVPAGHRRRGPSARLLRLADPLRTAGRSDRLPEGRSRAESAGRGHARDPSLYLFTVSGDRRSYRAVIEKSDLAAFHVVSRGAAGTAGIDGTPAWTASPASTETRQLSVVFGGRRQPGRRRNGRGTRWSRRQRRRRRRRGRAARMWRGGLLGRRGRSAAADGSQPGRARRCRRRRRPRRKRRARRLGRLGRHLRRIRTTGATSGVSGGSDGMSGGDGPPGAAGPDGAPGRPGVVRFQPAPPPG